MRMRTARLLSVIGAILTIGFGGGLLVAPAAGAQPPFRLAGYVTDNAGVLSDSGRATVTSAVDRLYTDRHIRLWVVYVDDFSGQGAVNWAERTARASDLGDYDALLAVATAGRAYAFLVPTAVKSVTARQVDDLRHNKIEPALHNGDWSGAAVAAANGLNTSPGSSGRVALLATLAIILAALAVLLLVMRYRRRRRRAADLAAARRVDPTDASALAGVPLQALDDLSRELVVDVDNAVRTSSNELDLAIAEFGEERTRPFTEAVDTAKAALSQSFTVRQQLDDNTPETPDQRRELLTRVVVSAARADRELESQTEAFENLRDLVINAPSRLDALTRQYVELTTRIAPSERRLAELHGQFDAAALSSVSGNVAAAEERLAFADRNISTARGLAGEAVSGRQAGLVDAVRAAESALGQARALLDSVDNAATDIQHAIDRLPAAVTDIQADIKRADELLQKARATKSAHTGDLVAARDAAARAVDARAPGPPPTRWGRSPNSPRRMPTSTASWSPWPASRPPPNSSTGPSSRRCSPPSPGCGRCPTTSTRAGAASARRLAPGSPKPNGTCRPRGTSGRGTRPRRFRTRTPRRRWPPRRSRWPTPTCSRRSAPTPAEAAATWARCWAGSSSATCSVGACGVGSAAGARRHSAALPAAASWGAAAGSERLTLVVRRSAGGRGMRYHASAARHFEVGFGFAFPPFPFVPLVGVGNRGGGRGVGHRIGGVGAHFGLRGPVVVVIGRHGHAPLERNRQAAEHPRLTPNRRHRLIW